MKKSALLLACGALASCGDTGRAFVDVPLYVAGTPARAVSIDEGTLTLSEAEVLLGPLYMCATESAEIELCETAVAEHLPLIAIDALAEEPAPVGQLSATTGSVRSAFFDYGMSWLLTKPRPAFPDDAPLAHSARLRFTAERGDGQLLTVLAELDIAPLSPGDAAVNGQKTEQTITRAPLQLTVEVDANLWLARVRLADLFALDEDGDGEVTLPSDSQAYEAILQGLTARYPASLHWSEP